MHTIPLIAEPFQMQMEFSIKLKGPSLDVGGVPKGCKDYGEWFPSFNPDGFSHQSTLTIPVGAAVMSGAKGPTISYVRMRIHKTIQFISSHPPHSPCVNMPNYTIP